MGHLVSRLPAQTRQRLKRALVVFWALSAVGVLGAAIGATFLQESLAGRVAGYSPLALLAVAAVLSFAAEYVDSSVGMGYGTTLTPLLLLLGFEPQVVVPAILTQQLVAGILAAASHHSLGNVNLTLRGTSLRLGLLLGVCGLLGGGVAARIAVGLPPRTVQAVTGVIVILMGVVLCLAGRIHSKFSWWRAGVLGAAAAANKGFMGGGYGPLVTGGQVLAGVAAPQAVAITCVAEVLTCTGGLAVYGLSGAPVQGHLTVGLILGGVLAVLPAAATVRVLSRNALTLGVAGACVVLGSLSLLRVLL